MDLAAERRAHTVISVIAVIAAVSLFGAVAFVATSQLFRETIASDRTGGTAAKRSFSPPKPRSPQRFGSAQAKPVRGKARKPNPSDASISQINDRYLPPFVPIAAAPGGREHNSLSQLYGHDIGPSLVELIQGQQCNVSSGPSPAFSLVEEADETEQPPDPLEAFINLALQDITEQVDSYTIYDGSGYFGVSIHALFKAPL